jgi:hypothetical protein
MTFADLFERAAECDASAEAVRAALADRRSASGRGSDSTESDAERDISPLE